MTNTATVAGGGDVNAGNNTATDPTTIGAGPDLTITKTHTGNFSQGQTGATYTITVSNAGGAATTGTITVTDTLPSGLTATAFSGAGWTCTVAPLSCTHSGPIAAGADAPALTLTVNVAPNAPATLTNTATVAGGGDVNAGNNTATDPTTIGAGPDLTITKTHTGNFTQGQTGATYTITVSNDGGAATTGAVTVTDTLPSGLTATAFSGTGWTCTVAPLSCTRSDSIGAGAIAPPLTLTVECRGQCAGQRDQHGDGRGRRRRQRGQQHGDRPDHDQRRARPHDHEDATRAVSRRARSGATYTITVTNAGNTPTSGPVTVTDTLPAGLTATALSGTGWTCTIAPLACTHAGAIPAGCRALPR